MPTAPAHLLIGLTMFVAALAARIFTANRTIHSRLLLTGTLALAYVGLTVALASGRVSPELAEQLRSVEHLLLALAPSGQEVARTAAGGYFGEMLLLTGESRTATVTALMDCTVLEITADTFRDVIYPNPGGHRTGERHCDAEKAEARAYESGDFSVGRKPSHVGGLPRSGETLSPFVVGDWGTRGRGRRRTLPRSYLVPSFPSPLVPLLEGPPHRRS